jgi:hypothetical protein
MTNNPTEKPHITFLFSDTGGGHRAASEAIIEALHCEFGEAVLGVKTISSPIDW